MVNKKDSLGDRMKLFYENRSKTYLVRRMPVIIRLDGCHFHTFTRGFDKPFDKVLIETMQETTLELCKSIQGCVLGYTQSDEITLVLTDYKSLESESWFDYSVQKLCSVSASLATLYFNKIFRKKVQEFSNEHYKEITEAKTSQQGDAFLFLMQGLMKSYNLAIETGATFDSRCFNIPKEEVTNCVLWRQQDCSRNSVSSLAQAHFSHKALQGKKSNEMQDMLMEKFGINWNNLTVVEKRGTCVRKTENGWVIDLDIPIFVGEGRLYIEELISFN